MSATLTPAADRARRRPWAQIDYLLAWTLYRDRYGASPSSLTLLLADRPLIVTTAGVPTGQYLPLVLDWGSLGDALNLTDPGLAIGNFTVTLANTVAVAGRARLSDLFRFGLGNPSGYDVTAGEARLALLFRGQSPALDAVQLFRLVSEEPTAITRESVTVNFSSIELGLEDRTKLLRITSDRFPLAAPSAIGQRIPLLCGVVRKVPALFIKAGLIDRLRVAITESSPRPGEWLQLSVPDTVGRWATSLPGVVQCDHEIMAIDAADSTTARLRIAPNGRGTGGTLAAAHAFGAEVTQGLDEYVGIFGQNPGAYAAAAFEGIYTDEVLKPATTKPMHTITLADPLTAEAPEWAALGYTFATVRFAAAFDDGGAGAIPYLEGAEVAIRAGCWSGGPPGYNGGPGFTLTGHGVFRCGIDAPCGTSWDYYRDVFRWNIDALAGSQSSVMLRFSPFNGLRNQYGLPGAAPQGPLEETFGASPHDTGYRDLLVSVVDWDAPLAPGVQAAGTLADFGSLANGQERDVFGYVVEVDLTTIYNSLKAGGATNLVVRIGVADESRPPRAWVNNWWPILADSIWRPTLYLGGVVADDGSLLRRPAGGQSNSAAEAALGSVTADLQGLSGAEPIVAIEPDVVVGTPFSGNKNSPAQMLSLAVAPGRNYLLAIVHEFANTTYPEGLDYYVASILYGGTPLTLLGRAIHTIATGNSHRTYVYGLAHPVTATALDLVISRVALAGDGGWRGVLVTQTLKNVGSVGPASTTDAAVAVGDFVHVATPIVGSGGLLVDFLTAGLGSLATSPFTHPDLRHPSAQTLAYRVQDPDVIGGQPIGVAYNMAIAGSRRRVLGPVSMQWDDANPVQGTPGANVAHVAVELRP